jgi:MFS-type transporter involved in bile tolerance (Atg22 family)
LFFVSDAGGDFRQLVYLDLTTEKAMTLLFGNEEIARRIAEHASRSAQLGRGGRCAVFFSVAVWWGVFAIPLLKSVPEPPGSRLPRVQLARSSSSPPSAPNVLTEAFQRLSRTFGEVARYRQLLIFLIAFWLSNDGIGTIIKMTRPWGTKSVSRCPI